MSLRILLVLPGVRTDEMKAKSRELAREGKGQRWMTVSDTLGGHSVDHGSLATAPGLWRSVYRVLPSFFALAVEAWRQGRRYDVIVSWAEKTSLYLAMIQTLTFDKRPHVAMLYWFSKATVRWPLALFGRSLAGVVTWSSVQMRYAVDRLGLPEERFTFTRHFVDEEFWRADRVSGVAVDPELVVAAGAEMRDYPTLIEAMRGTSLKCHIASREMRITGGLKTRRVDAQELAPTLPANVTLAPKAQAELRELYARAAFVVVPLVATDTDNGVNVLLEAMAMGKAVICSRTVGQVDVIEDGVTGIFVPVGDVAALRRAIEDLSRDPARAKAMGEAARRYVEKHHTLRQFAEDVRMAAEKAAKRRD